jgi:cytochrome c-type biogenesis protein CcmF
MPGTLGIYLAFITVLLSGLLFLFLAVKEPPAKSRIEIAARLLYRFHAGALVIAGIYLFYALLTHQFQYYYVYAHSSGELPVGYLISAFWAGQQGTLLLWAIFPALIGLILVDKKTLLSPMLVFYLGGQVFLCLFLLLDSPFKLVSPVPLTGSGLNPLLMDPYMVIHPPVIFAGYALLAVPCCYALAALWKKEFRQGAMEALPWAVSGWFFLGAGIIIGGAWAYRVLGWGGYWGWDPVENASLVPWLTAGIAVHSLLALRGGMKYYRSGLFFCIITYVLVILATVITRSGVIAQFSVHAFTETMISPFLFAFLLFYLLLGLILFAGRFQELGLIGREQKQTRRSNLFLYLAITLSVVALLILLGTLSPLISGLTGQHAGVDESYYLKTGYLPLLLLFILLALCSRPLWNGNKDRFRKTLKLLIAPLFLTLALLYLAFVYGLHSRSGLILLTVIMAAFCLTGVDLVKTLKTNWKQAGGKLAHFGLILMFAGIIFSSGLQESKIIFLPRDEKVEALGYHFLYHDYDQTAGKASLKVLVTSEEETFFAYLPYYYQGGRLMREPFIKRYLFRDLYLSPLELQGAEEIEQLVMEKGGYLVWKNYRLYFRDLVFSRDVQSALMIEAIIDLVGFNQVTSVAPALRQADDEWEPVTAILPGGEELVPLLIDSNQEIMIFNITESDCCKEPELLVMEAKSKPLVNLLLAGSIFLMVGTGLAAWRRFASSLIS